MRSSRTSGLLAVIFVVCPNKSVILLLYLNIHLNLLQMLRNMRRVASALEQHSVRGQQPGAFSQVSPGGTVDASENSLSHHPCGVRKVVKRDLGRVEKAKPFIPHSAVQRSLLPLVSQAQGATVTYSSWWPRWNSSNTKEGEASASASTDSAAAAEKKEDASAGPSTTTAGAAAAADGEAAAKGPTMEQLLAALKEKDTLLEDANKKLEEARESVLRARADSQNLLDRTKREMDNARQFALQGFVKSILEVADNLERAIQAVPPELLVREEGKVRLYKQQRRIPFQKC